jgi:diaminopimelate epimerase
MLLESSELAAVRMRTFNADGSEPAMCGNGSRCLAHFARALGAAGDEMKIETLAGVLHAKVEGPRVRVELTRPEEVVSRGELEFAGERREVFFTNTGVPHAIVFVDDIEGVPVREWGKALRFHKDFGDPGANADFVKVLAPGRIALRTYERGVEDETLACGTGAVASALIAAWREGWPSPVAVHVRSGEELEISFLGPAPRCAVTPRHYARASTAYCGSRLRNPPGSSYGTRLLEYCAPRIPQASRVSCPRGPPHRGVGLGRRPAPRGSAGARPTVRTAPPLGSPRARRSCP